MNSARHERYREDKRIKFSGCNKFKITIPLMNGARELQFNGDTKLQNRFLSVIMILEIYKVSSSNKI